MTAKILDWLNVPLHGAHRRAPHRCTVARARTFLRGLLRLSLRMDRRAQRRRDVCGDAADRVRAARIVDVSDGLRSERLQSARRAGCRAHGRWEACLIRASTSDDAGFGWPQMMPVAVPPPGRILCRHQAAIPGRRGGARCCREVRPRAIGPSCTRAITIARREYL